MPAPGCGRATMPADSNVSRRFLSRLGLIPGTPRWMSLNLVAPAHNSRRISSIQRCVRVSEAKARGQNCRYPSLTVGWYTREGGRLVQKKD